MGASGASGMNATNNVAARAFWAPAVTVIGLKNASGSQRSKTMINVISTTCFSLRSDPQAPPIWRPAGHGYSVGVSSRRPDPALFLACLPGSVGAGRFLVQVRHRPLLAAACGRVE